MSPQLERRYRIGTQAYEENSIPEEVIQERIKIPSEEVKRPPKKIVDELLKVKDLSSTVSDVLDKWGIPRVIPATILKPSFYGAKVVGPALTLRNVPRLEEAVRMAEKNESFLAEAQLWNIAKPGDVAVMASAGLDISSMGGISALRAKTVGVMGSIVDGSVRDIESQVELKHPIWSRGQSPITRKWRMETILLNSEVRIVNVTVNPGDLVIADMTGVCFVPPGRVEELYEKVLEIEGNEDKTRERTAAGQITFRPHAPKGK